MEAPGEGDGAVEEEVDVNEAEKIATAGRDSCTSVPVLPLPSETKYSSLSRIGVAPSETSPSAPQGGGRGGEGGGGGGAPAAGALPPQQAPSRPLSNSLSSTGRADLLRPNLHLEIIQLAQSAAAASLDVDRLSSSGSVFSYTLSRSEVQVGLPPSLRQSTSSSSSAAAGGGTSRSVDSEHGDSDLQQELTDKAVVVIRRVMDKLTGLDFCRSDVAPIASAAMGTGESATPGSTPPSGPPSTTTALDVPAQVDRLIIEATSNENLSLCFFGWCPFW